MASRSLASQGGRAGEMMEGIALNCLRGECGNPIPQGRRKFCSDDCAKLFHRNRKGSDALRQQGRNNVLEAGVRVCLGCDDEFPSDGPWNRLCDKCKRREVYQ